MSLSCEERLSDSPYVDTIEHVIAEQAGSTICPANGRWYMLATRQNDKCHFSIVGPLTKASPTRYIEGAEFLFIKFKMGMFLQPFPAKSLLDSDIILPEATSKKFWLNGSAWELPNYDNIEEFVRRLVCEDLLISDAVVNTVLQDEHIDIARRTVRHRFLQSTGLSQSYIRQIERARRAKTLLEQGVSILDTVYQTGYSDQSHLTRSFKQFIGYTPAHIFHKVEPEMEYQ